MVPAIGYAPVAAQRGVQRLVLATCEIAALTEGSARAELIAPLTVAMPYVRVDKHILGYGGVTLRGRSSNARSCGRAIGWRGEAA